MHMRVSNIQESSMIQWEWHNDFVFKKNIQNRLLQVLMEENDYVGTPSLIISF